MTRILGTFFILVSICSGVSALNANVSLVFVSGTVGEGENLTMQCTLISGIQNATWIRNDVSIFSTSNETSTAIKTENSTFNLVAGRMIVTTSGTHHKVTLKINSTLDHGSVWQCMVGDKLSSKLEISVDSASSEVSSSEAATFVSGEKSTSEISSIMPTTEDSSVRTTNAQTTKDDTSGISSRHTATEGSSVRTTNGQTTKDDTSGISSRHTATGQHTSTSTPLLGSECECKACSNLLLLGVGTCMAGTLLLVGLCHLVIYLIRRKNTDCLSGKHYDGFQGRNVDARTGYDEICFPRSQEADIAEGDEYEMTGNHYENLQGGNDDDTTGYVEVVTPRNNVNAEGAEGEASEAIGMNFRLAT